jgi:hypothetical protein
MLLAFYIPVDVEPAVRPLEIVKSSTMLTLYDTLRCLLRDVANSTNVSNKQSGRIPGTHRQ